MNKHSGLTAKEVELSRRTHGENRFSETGRRNFFVEFLKGFSDPIIIILLAALCINVFFSIRDGDYYESIGIAAAVFLSVFVSTLSEYKSEKAFEKMRREAGETLCRVRRGGKVCTLPAGEIVVGDVVLLASGDTIPADGIMLYGTLGINQSTLNGESREAEKHPSAEQSALSDAGALFCGTLVSSGEGEMQVTTVGDSTLYGKLAAELSQAKGKSPLKEKLTSLAKTLSAIGYFAAALVAGADLLYEIFRLGDGNLLSGFAVLAASPALLLEPLLHALTLAVTVVVVAVPEGLPMMITVVLSSQMRRMMRQGVLVRKLAGIETAGNVDLLFCDKTGTLTEGTHSVRALFRFDGERLVSFTPDRRALAEHFLLNNQARLEGGIPRGSNATDRALLAYSKACSVPALSVMERIPFESAHKFSAVLLSDGRKLYKGAPEVLLKHATEIALERETLRLTPALRARITAACAAKEEAGERLIAFAEGGNGGLSYAPSALKISFFATLSDALRAETRETVETLTGAGIRVVMLTGDAGRTAKSIAKKARILHPGDLCLSSDELSAMKDEEICSAFDRLSVVYRCTPADKSRLATLAARAGRVSAMTGDGVNDAPALKLADVGFAMGSGTQIARDAADIVLTDDRLASLANAVLYGRTVFRSIQKFVTFQLTMNFCAVLVSFFGPMCGIETPITVLQMLWINLIMDTLASLAFAGEAPRKSYLAEKPLRRTAPILSRRVLGQIVFGTCFSLAASLTFLNSHTLRKLYGFPENEGPFLTAFFLLFVFLGVFNMLNVRTPRLKLWAQLWQNGGFVAIFFLITGVQIAFPLIGSALFRCTLLEAPLISLPILLALSIVPADLLRKSLFRKKRS